LERMKAVMQRPRRTIIQAEFCRARRIRRSSTRNAADPQFW
jgi:hypothetical protein